MHDEAQRVIAAYGFEREDGFDRLARSLARYQAVHHPGYARLCAARGVSPGESPARSLPAVPTEAFRWTRVACFPPDEQIRVFQTSGTTTGARGAHALRRLDTYRAAALRAAEAMLWVPGGQVLAIAASPDRAPDSSLSCMLGWFVEECGGRFLAPESAAQVRAALSVVTAPVLVCATAFAWVHLLDDGLTVRLPAGSRAMQTGGFKGRSREVSAVDLRAGIAGALGLSPAAVIGEYGMTELSSQLYSVGEGALFRYRAPPWVRVVACAPDTLAPLDAGQPGVLRVEDLANVESAWAVQTADVGVVAADGLIELHGRAPGAPPRGCSLSVEELLDP